MLALAGAGLVATGSLTSSVAQAAQPGPAQTAASGPRIQSVGWSSPARGWLLGTAACGTRTCTKVLTTGNAGHTWSAAGVVPAPIARSAGPGVSTIRFADSKHGWAFGPSLFATTNGGRTWRPEPLPGGGRQSLTVAADSSTVYLAVSPCASGSPCTQRSTLWRSAVTKPAWHRVPVTLPATGGSIEVLVSLSGNAAYVAVPGPPPAADTLYASVDSGTHWAARRSPCDKTTRGESLTGVAAMPDRKVALLCVGNVGMSMSDKHVFRSANAGLTTTDAGFAPVNGIPSELAAAPGGTLAVGSFAAGSWIYRNGGGSAWSTVLSNPGSGLGDLTFTTDNDGYAVLAPITDGGNGTLLGSTDGGRHWSTITVH